MPKGSVERDPKTGLTHAEDLFVEVYCKTLCWADAGRAAGLKQGCTAHHWSRRPNIQKAIKKRISAKVRRHKVSADRVMERLVAIAFANVPDVVKIVEHIPDEGEDFEPYKTVELLPTEYWPDDIKAAVTSIKQGKEGIELKTDDRFRALEILAKHFGVLNEKRETVVSPVILLPQPQQSFEDWQEAALKAGADSRDKLDEVLSSRSDGDDA